MSVFIAWAKQPSMLVQGIPRDGLLLLTWRCRLMQSMLVLRRPRPVWLAKVLCSGAKRPRRRY